MIARWNVRARTAQAGALLAAVVLCVAASPAGAEVRVADAGGGRLVIEAHDATLRQILDSLSASHTIRFQTSDALSRHVTGTYAGTLPRVLSRMLDGYDHVILSTPSGIQIDIVGAAKSARSVAQIANSVTVSAVARTEPRVSSNVDLDEEDAFRNTAAAGPRTVNLASAPHPSAPAVRPAPMIPSGNGQHPNVPRVSSNVDLDEDMSQ